MQCVIEENIIEKFNPGRNRENTKVIFARRGKAH